MLYEYVVTHVVVIISDSLCNYRMTVSVLLSTKI